MVITKFTQSVIKSRPLNKIGAEQVGASTPQRLVFIGHRSSLTSKLWKRACLIFRNLILKIQRLCKRKLGLLRSWREPRIAIRNMLQRTRASSRLCSKSYWPLITHRKVWMVHSRYTLRLISLRFRPELLSSYRGPFIHQFPKGRSEVNFIFSDLGWHTCLTDFGPERYSPYWSTTPARHIPFRHLYQFWTFRHLLPHSYRHGPPCFCRYLSNGHITSWQFSVIIFSYQRCCWLAKPIEIWQYGWYWKIRNAQSVRRIQETG